MGAHDQAITAGQRAIALATASGDLVRQALANLNLGFAYLAWGDYRQAIDCFDQTMASLAGPARHERFGQVNLPAVTCRAWAPGAMLNSAASLRAGSSEKKRSRSPTGSLIPRASWWPCGGRVECRSAKAMFPERPPCSNGP